MRRLILAICTALAFAVPAAAFETRSLAADLQPARRAMLAEETISMTNMRRLADAGDGLAAFRYARRLEETGRRGLLDDAAHYYAMAAYSGRDYAVKPLVRILEAADVAIPDNRLPHMLNALTRSSADGNPVATGAMARLLISGRRVPPDPARAAAYLRASAGGGNGRVLIDAAVQAMADPQDQAAGHPRAREFLDLAVGSGDLAARVTAENLRRPLPADPATAALPDDLAEGATQ